MQNLLIIARIKIGEKEEVGGYRVINVDTEETGDLQIRRLCQIVEYNGANVLNAEIDTNNEIVKITQGAEEVYPTFIHPSGRFLDDNMSVTIMGKNIDGAYKVANPMGIVHTMSEEKLLKLAETKGLTNAKVVKGKIVAKKGKVDNIIGFNYNYTEKDFATPNEMGYVKKWKVRLIKTGEPYGVSGNMVNDKETMVEFISVDTNQFVSRYYLSTILEDYPSNRGLRLYGDVNAWTIDAENYAKIRKWLSKI